MRNQKWVILAILLAQLVGCENSLVGWPETDGTAPSVSSVTPVDGAMDVASNASITAIFSEKMEPETISAATFTLFDGAIAVTGAVTYSGITAIFTPTSILNSDTLYTATITTGVKDQAGNALGADYVWTFFTGTGLDALPPTVISTVPLSDSVNVAMNASLTAIFSEEMDPATISTMTFTLEDGATPVLGTVNLVGATATFNPTNNLDPETEYTATITAQAADLAGNTLVADYEWTFTTGIAPDTTPPTVVLTSPEDEDTNVAFGANVVATFSENMDSATISTLTFTLQDGLTPVLGTVNLVGAIATFNPANNLDPETEYTATITADAADLAGNTLVADYEWTFTTGIAPDTTPPTVILTSPEDEDTNVAFGANVVATFSENMDSATISTLTFTLLDGLTPVLGTVNLVGAIATFNPANNLDPETEYTATITAQAADLAGNTLVANFEWTFTTGIAPDTTPPTVILTSPEDEDIEVALNANVVATFSEEMDELTITDLTFTLMNGLVPVEGMVTLLGNTATFNPTVDLDPETEYTALVTADATDLSGNPLEDGLVPNPWTFTTEAGPPPFVSLDLGLATPFAIAATAGVTNTLTAPLTHINGDVVLDPLGQCNAIPVDGAGGFGLCGGAAPTINGTVITGTYPDTTTAAAVKADLNAAFLMITPPAGPPAVGSLGGGTPLAAPTTLGGVTGSALVLGDNKFTPGVYTSITSILITGDILLDGLGDPNATFIFQSASTLITADGAPLTHTRVLLTGGASAANVWWQVGSSATIGLYTEFQGNILAAFDITMKTSSTACGRSMAGAWVGGAGAFVFDSNVVSVPGQCPAP